MFAGDAFISNPPAVVFKDFVPGQTCTASVQLINRSFTGSSIRVLEVPTEVGPVSTELLCVSLHALWAIRRGL